MMRRFSKTSSARNSHVSNPPTTVYSPPQSTGPNGTAPSSFNGHVNDSRPASVSTSNSFDFTSQAPMSTSGPVSSHVLNNPSHPISTTAFSRTDLIVLKHFWDIKFQENANRDLHFLKFPPFPSTPEHKHLLPYCEIYHLIKSQPGAKIIGLGSSSTNGVYIGFELFEGSQLHIDLDDEWHGITHYRVNFKSFDKLVASNSNAADADAAFRSWPKPVTIEFLEEQYAVGWSMDLRSVCWDPKEVRELGGGSGGGRGSRNGSGDGL